MSTQPEGQRSQPPKSLKGRGKPRSKPNQPGSSSSNGDGGSAKLRGLPSDSPQVRLSKTLSWILRHGAASQGLVIRPDGYLKVDDLLANSKIKSQGLDLEGLRAIVADDAKKRYDLKQEEDGMWWIRANQGHSMKDVADLETTPIVSVSDIPSGIAVHGTTMKAWKSIAKEGLSKMTRNHIHLAQGLSGPDSAVISGMRKSSQILVYIDIPKALSGGIEFVLSSNGVVLSKGDERGFIPPVYFEKVVNAKTGVELEGWRAGEGGPSTGDSKEVAVESAPAD